MDEHTRGDRTELRRSRIAHRTSELPVMSRLLYRIEHYTSFPTTGVGVITVMLGLIVVGAALGFPGGWVTTFEVAASAVTLVMVFAIQHTQGREQAATQRKLDELLRAVPGADNSLMMLEEAPTHDILDVEEGQRERRSEPDPPEPDGGSLPAPVASAAKDR
jgi:low affinity Fe/Cu permease